MPMIAPASPKTVASATLHTHSPAPLALGDRIGEVAVVQVAAGAEYGVATRSDGAIVPTGWCRPFSPPAAVQGRAVAIHADSDSSSAVDCDGRLRGWGRTHEVDRLPFEPTDEAWLEFATRLDIEAKLRIYAGAHPPVAAVRDDLGPSDALTGMTS